MPKITNSRGDSVTVNCGGIGNDNILGTVEEKVGNTEVPVQGARVRIINFTNSETATAKTDRDGDYDEDLNAQTGHRILVIVEWTDSNDRYHQIRGTITVTCGTEDENECSESASYAEIGGIGALALDRLIELGKAREAASDLHTDVTLGVIDFLDGLKDVKNREDQQEILDGSIAEELSRMLQKLEYLRQSGQIPPSQDLHWLFTIELFALGLKLVAKADWLQQQPYPDFRPPPGGGGVA